MTTKTICKICGAKEYSLRWYNQHYKRMYCTNCGSSSEGIERKAIKHEITPNMNMF